MCVDRATRLVKSQQGAGKEYVCIARCGGAAAAGVLLRGAGQAGQECGCIARRAGGGSAAEMVVRILSLELSAHCQA